MIKKLTFILFTIVSCLVFGQADSIKTKDIKEVSSEKTWFFENVNILKSLDTVLVSSTLLDPEEDIFIPSFFAVNSGLYKFPIILDLDDLGWVSKHLMQTYSKLEFKSDTTPSIEAKYDQAYANTHWFTASFDRMVGKSKITSKISQTYNLNFPAKIARCASKKK